MGTAAELKALLVARYGVDEAEIAPDATLSQLGLDSLSMAELVFDIEDLFGIEIDAEDAEFETLEEAVALVDRHVEAKGG